MAWVIMYLYFNFTKSADFYSNIEVSLFICTLYMFFVIWLKGLYLSFYTHWKNYQNVMVCHVLTVTLGSISVHALFLIKLGQEIALCNHRTTQLSYTVTCLDVCSCMFACPCMRVFFTSADFCRPVIVLWALQDNNVLVLTNQVHVISAANTSHIPVLNYVY